MTMDADKLWNIEEQIVLYVPPFIIFPGAVGNILCFIVLQTPSFRKASTGFLLSALAAVNTTALCSAPLYVWLFEAGTSSDYEVVPDEPATDTSSCYLEVIFMYIPAQVSSWTLVMVTFERLLAIKLPMKVHILCSRKRMVIAWCTMVVLLCSFNVCFIVRMHLKEEVFSQENATSCMSQDLETILTWYDLLFRVGLPCVFIFTFNTIIARKLFKMSTRRRRMLSSQPSDSTPTARSVTQMLFVVSTAYLITALPICVYYISIRLWYDEDDDERELAIYYLAMAIIEQLTNLNYSITGILYLISGSQFRRAFATVFCRCRQKATNTNQKMVVFTTRASRQELRN